MRSTTAPYTESRLTRSVANERVGFPVVEHRQYRESSEPVFLNVYGAQKSIPRNEFASLCSPAGWYNNHIPTQFL
jgi:hypothetical protein